MVREDPTLSPKRALALVRGLPRESRTACLLQGNEEAAGWDTQAYLTAYLIDVVRENTFVNMQVRTKKKIKPFEQVPLPGSKKKQPEANRFIRMAQEQMNKRKE